MASTSSHTVIDDDEDFDWEAAVREIDSACLAAKPAMSAPPLIKPFRQSTLHEFVRKPVPFQEILEERNAEISGVPIDPEAAQTWIYPVNIPLRDYQLSITRTALFSNTLVALPTGLGKTLIAAVVMYNYFRWFPKGKIIFAAPSRPLVMQQIEACHNIVGIPQDWTIDMTGQVNPSTRMHLWKAKRVFFVTPQVLENDIRSGTCLAKDLVCLVIDEAHRASGNYSYCVAVRELMNVPVQLRILALTATPGSKQQSIQQVIDNLQMSTLEYRTESDPDVSPYVHERKIELIEVAMGPDAIEINNMLLEVARPFVGRLSAMGVLSNRDLRTLSPCDFLNARDKFRQEPPLNLPQLKYAEVEGFLGVLITLYHIFKLLSTHGIKPAYEMLVDKLKQGPFARYMSRNEGLEKAKFLMHQSLSHGAPSPKLSKMLEVLIDHFKRKDPLNSRVIIFSNFRGSVRDIMDALSTIGEYVKATQFIGQSSGKTLKGQSQKAQQAVLEKFRAGGYNVIVATSIGEEGLDIMEVDLVICFDANISPLRMIQRMGRTGRKNDGRVVVLACEGSELKGYKRKQGNGNMIKKHLRNGGMNSFNFHASPRMIPHIFSPEVKLVELSIEQFVPRGRKVKDDHPSEVPPYKTKLTDDESNLIAMYFDPAKESTTWQPSLIAFPHFQAFPSRVHGIKHSLRTGMLIDAMQSLQGLSFTRDTEASNREDEDMPDLELGVTTAFQQENSIKGSWISHNSQEECLFEKAPNDDPSVKENPATVNKNHQPSCCDQISPIHSYLFGSDFVSVDYVGRVMILPVPLLPVKEAPRVNCLKQDFSQLESSFKDKDDTSWVQQISEPITTSPTRCTQTKNGTGLISADYKCDELKDVELSPRLSNFIQSGVVPESPVDCPGTSRNRENENWIPPDLCPPCISNSEASPKISSIPVQTDKSVSNMHLPASSVSKEVQTPVLNSINCHVARTSVVRSPIFEQLQAPLADSLSDGSSRDWCLSSGDKPGSVQKERKFKRLRKYGDHQKLMHTEGEKDDVGRELNKSRAPRRSTPVLVENGVGKRKRVKDARAFIEEEAEVSSEADVSDDEEDVQEINSSYEDSFIDDKINPTASTSTQAESYAGDMMAIYRRSLLSQSPMVRLSNGCTNHTPDSVAPSSRTSDSTTPSGTLTNHSLITPRHVPETESIEKISSESIPCRESVIHNENENENEVWKRKRKLSFNQIPTINLEKRFAAQDNPVSREIYQCNQVDRIQRFEANGDAFEDIDDKFFEGIDLDAVEEQATKLLQRKLEQPLPNRTIRSNPNKPQVNLKGSPSFDLGI